MMRTAALLLVALALPARAEKPAAELTRYEQEVTAYEARDEARQATHEIGTLRAWLGEARAYQNQEAQKPLARTLERIRVQARLIDALLLRAAAEGEARKLSAEADAKERAATDARNAAFELEQRLASLESQARQEAPK
ncbi:MAG: hypothetical protein KC620_18160 [Myxococcales bacterium]|nr:hypothetical protein [Myxococcales bacterium]